MKAPQITFIVESAHGHINPTLSTASELVRRGYHVSHAVKEYFAARVSASGSEPIIYRPLGNKNMLFLEIYKHSKLRSFDFDFSALDVIDSAQFMKLMEEETADSLEQLEYCYRDRRPDLIIYDRTTLVGRLLAQKWSIPTIEHSPMLIAEPMVDYDPKLVIVSLPRCFQEDADKLDGRFKFVGPILCEGMFFRPWNPRVDDGKVILVSATTYFHFQAEYFTKVIEAFRDFTQRIVLSIGDNIDPTALGPLPANFEINQHSSQREILKHACLFVGQGGPSSTLEALSCGVPLLLMPPSQFHDRYARRMADLNLGIRLGKHEAKPENIRQSAINLLNDAELSMRVRHAQRAVTGSRGAVLAADLVERFVTAGCTGLLA